MGRVMGGPDSPKFGSFIYSTNYSSSIFLTFYLHMYVCKLVHIISLSNLGPRSVDQSLSLALQVLTM